MKSRFFLLAAKPIVTFNFQLFSLGQQCDILYHSSFLFNLLSSIMAKPWSILIPKAYSRNPNHHCFLLLSFFVKERRVFHIYQIKRAFVLNAFLHFFAPFEPGSLNLLACVNLRLDFTRQGFRFDTQRSFSQNLQSNNIFK